MTVETLLISGTCGSGKSTIAAEIDDTLGELGVPNAAIDLDALVWQWPSTSMWNNDLMFENLAALWPNYESRGVRHLVLARVVENQSELDRYRAAVPGANITVCRLVSPESLRVARLRRRMAPGRARDWHLERTVELERLLADREVEDFTVENGEQTVRAVAVEVLSRAGWISPTQATEAIGYDNRSSAP